MSRIILSFAYLIMYKVGVPCVKKRISFPHPIHLTPIMLFFAPLAIFLASTTFTTALPIGISYSEDLKTAIAQKRARERDLAILTSLSEEKRAYQLETVEVATFRYKRDVNATR